MASSALAIPPSPPQGPAAAVNVENDAYTSGWNGDTSNAPTQNAIYDYLIQLDTDADGDIDSVDASASVGDMQKVVYDVGADGTVDEATALAADPADCADNEFADEINASGTLACKAIADADVPNTITIDAATLASTITVTDDEATAAAREILFTTVPGTATVYSSSAVSINPSTGVLTAAGFAGEATTAAALAANPAAATAGTCITNIAANGDVEAEVDVWTETENTNAAYSPLASPTFTGTVTVPSTNFTIGSTTASEAQWTDLTDAGESAAHTHAAGGGNVSKVGTPVDVQIGVWTGDGTIEGDVDFLFDTTANDLQIGEIGDTSIVSIGTANILVDNPRGTMTLSNIDAIDATTETTLEAAIDSLSSQTVTGTIATGTWEATDVGVAHGGTGASTKSTGFNALSPMTTIGDLIYGGASGTGTRLAAGATTTILVGGGAAAPVWTTATGTGAPVRGTSPQFTTAMTTAGAFAINPGGALTIGDNGDTLVINSNDWDISATGVMTGIGNITSNGTIGGTVITASTSHIGPLLDAAGDEDMDYGSADVDDHTFITDGTGTAEFVIPVGSIDSTEILNDTILEIDLNSVNGPTDEYCLTYEDTTKDFEWQVCGSAGITYSTKASGGDTLVDGDCGGFHISTGAQTITLPDCDAGLLGCRIQVMNNDTGELTKVATPADDVGYLIDGTSLGGVAQDFGLSQTDHSSGTFVCAFADMWYVVSQVGVITDEN